MARRDPLQAVEAKRLAINPSTMSSYACPPCLRTIHLSKHGRHAWSVLRQAQDGGGRVRRAHGYKALAAKARCAEHPRPQIMEAARLMVSASTAVLKKKEMIACRVASRRNGLVKIDTSEVCEAAPNEVEK